jgi:hypothetical protein
MVSRKKISLAAAAIFIFGLFLFLTSIKTFADTSSTGSGWLWGGTDDGAGNTTGLGWISLNNTNTSGATSYGVNIPSSGGSLSGYAWSENVGWINFSGASRSGNTIIGSATIQGIADEAAAGNSGGWQGQISLSGTAQDGSPYGVSIDTTKTPNQLSGYGWSDELGWIDFSRASIVPCVPSGTSTYSCVVGTCDASTCEQTIASHCIKTDSCGTPTVTGTSDCSANGVACSNTVCPVCTDKNFREVAP